MWSEGFPSSTQATSRSFSSTASPSETINTTVHYLTRTSQVIEIPYIIDPMVKLIHETNLFEVSNFSSLSAALDIMRV